jgi:hypothetical protein
MRRKEDDSVRITSAHRPRSEDIGGRQKRYLISMAIRTACFILAVVSIGHWFMWVFLVGAVFLPYVAVVMANAGAPTDPDDEAYHYDPDLRALRDRPEEPHGHSS